jgi:hypothetical protein
MRLFLLLVNLMSLIEFSLPVSSMFDDLHP